MFTTTLIASNATNHRLFRIFKCHSFLALQGPQLKNLNKLIVVKMHQLNIHNLTETLNPAHFTSITT